MINNDNNNETKSSFNTHKKDPCTVLHLNIIKTKFVPYRLLERKEKIIMSQCLLKYNPRKCFSTKYYHYYY